MAWQPSKSVYDPEKKIWQSRFLEKSGSAAVCVAAHRANETQRLHSVDVIRCCGSNRAWLTRTSPILCVWDVTASNALPSSECSSASRPSDTLSYTLAHKGAHVYVYVVWCWFACAYTWHEHALEKAICFCACLLAYCSPSFAAALEAVLRTLARAKSGLHPAFVIRAGFLLRGKLLGSVKREKRKKEIKSCHCLWEGCCCVLFTLSERAECVAVAVSLFLSSSSLLLTVFVSGYFELEEEILSLIHFKFWSICKMEVFLWEVFSHFAVSAGDQCLSWLEL